MDALDVSTESSGEAVEMPGLDVQSAQKKRHNGARKRAASPTARKSHNHRKHTTTSNKGSPAPNRRAIVSSIDLPGNDGLGEDVELEDPDLVDKAEMQGALMYFKKNKHNSKLSRTCVCWLMWFIIFTTAVFMAREVSKGYELEASLKDILMDEEFDEEDTHIRKTFRDIGEPEELWHWLQGPLLNGVGQQDLEEEAFVLGHNRLLGSVRLRQLRVKSDSCVITEAMRPFMKGCFADYTSSTKSTETFGPGTSGFVYQETNSPLQLGESLTSYDSGGFVVDLSYNAIVAAQQLQALRDQGWIDRNTKVVMVTVNVFNPNVNNFLSMVFMIETYRGGLLIPTITFRSFRADLYLTEADEFRLFLEILVALMIVGMDLQMLGTMVNVLKKKKNLVTWLLTPWWNLIHLLNISLATAGAILYTNFVLDLNDFRSNIKSLNQDRDFSRMEELGYQWTIAFNLFAGVLFLSIFYFFKFLNVNFRMALLWRTLQRAGADLASFLIFFFIIFLAYVVTGYMIFGTELYSWRSFNASFFTSFNILLGDFDYNELAEEGHRYLAPVWFITFVVMITFILMNMFLAILNAAWDELQKELDEHDTLGEALRKALMSRYTWVVDRLKNTAAMKPKFDKNFGKSLIRQLDVRELANDSESDDNDNQGNDLDKMEDARLLLGEWGRKLNLQDSDISLMRELVNKYRRSREIKMERVAQRAKSENNVTFSDFMLVMMQLQRLETAMGLSPTPIDAERAAAVGGTAGLQTRHSAVPNVRMSRNSLVSGDIGLNNSGQTNFLDDSTASTDED